MLRNYILKVLPVNIIHIFTSAFETDDTSYVQLMPFIHCFGLASIPIILEKQLGKKYHYTGVEIDEEVLYLVNKYAMDELTSSFNLICADAQAYVMQCTEQFDLVIMDVFFDDLIPEQFETEDFLTRLKDLVKADGLLMYNRLAFNKRDINTSKEFYEGAFSSIFDQGTFLEVKGNWMLLNRNDVLK